MADASYVNTPEWAAVIKGLLRSEMTLRSITYAELSTRLEQQFGTHQTESNLKAKINKGVLGAQLFVQILAVVGAEKLDLAQVLKLHDELSKVK
ncbi:DUF6471 domain-containing protein [Kaarinaea lacus]